MTTGRAGVCQRLRATCPPPGPWTAQAVRRPVRVDGDRHATVVATGTPRHLVVAAEVPAPPSPPGHRGPDHRRGPSSLTCPSADGPGEGSDDPHRSRTWCVPTWPGCGDALPGDAGGPNAVAGSAGGGRCTCRWAGSGRIAAHTVGGGAVHRRLPGTRSEGSGGGRSRPSHRLVPSSSVRATAAEIATLIAVDAGAVEVDVAIADAVARATAKAAQPALEKAEKKTTSRGR